MASSTGRDEANVVEVEKIVKDFKAAVRLTELHRARLLCTPVLPPETVEYFLNRGGCAPAEDDAVRLATLATEILGNDVVARMCNTNDYLQAENADGASRTGRAAMDDGEPITSISVQAPLEVLRQTLGVMSLPYVPDDREEPRP